MTKAICIECGEEKLGAWTLCASCSFKPQTADDFMKSIALSEWYANDTQLMQWKADIKAGNKPVLDDRAREILSGSLTLHTAHGEFNPVLNFPFDDSTMAAWRERNPELVDVKLPHNSSLPSRPQGESASSMSRADAPTNVQASGDHEDCQAETSRAVALNLNLLVNSLKRLASAEVGAMLLLAAGRTEIPVIDSGGFFGLFVLCWALIEFFVCLWHYLGYRESLGTARATTYVAWTALAPIFLAILVTLALYPPKLFDDFIPTLFAGITRPVAWYGAFLAIAATLAGYKLSSIYPMRNWCVTASLGGLVLASTLEAGSGWLGPICGIAFVAGASYSTRQA